MDLIALFFTYAGVALFIVTRVLTAWRYAALRRLPRRPFTWMTLADWVLVSGPGLSLEMAIVAFGVVVARWRGGSEGQPKGHVLELHAIILFCSNGRRNLGRL